MNAYLQEERQRCQLLASQLGREQQGAESRAAEASNRAHGIGREASGMRWTGVAAEGVALLPLHFMLSGGP